MNSRNLVNLLLLVTLIAFASFYIHKKNQSVEIKRLTTLDISEITNIKIPREDGTEILFEKTAISNGQSEWQMRRPYQMKAHQFRINSLLGLTQTPVDKIYNASTLELSQYALDKPRAQIYFNDTLISFGKSSPVNNKRYLMTGSQLTLLEDQIYPLVSAQPTTFIDLNLLNTGHDIIAIKTPDIYLTKNDSGLWVTQPEMQLNADEIHSLLEDWKNLQAFAVHRYMKRKQLGEIIITTKDQQIIFEISDDDPWLILARPDLGIEYHIDNTLKKKLLGPADA